jgi:hypothetical protein
MPYEISMLLDERVEPPPPFPVAAMAGDFEHVELADQLAQRD